MNKIVFNTIYLVDFVLSIIFTLNLNFRLPKIPNNYLIFIDYTLKKVLNRLNWLPQQPLFSQSDFRNFERSHNTRL